MRLNPDFKLNVVSGESMLVNTSKRAVDLTTVYSLSETAAWLWKKIGDAEFDEDMLAQWVFDEYDIDMFSASKDVKDLLAQWKRFGIAI